MKATEFCNFFDFTLEKGEFEVKNDIIYDDGVYKYCATDDQACWDDRYVNDVNDLASEFDSCLQNYVNDYIEEDGFEYDKEKDGSYYDQAVEFAEGIYKEDSIFIHVLKVLNGTEELEDDT